MDDKFIILLTKELSGEINPDEAKELQSLLNDNATYRGQYNAFKMYWENKDAEYADDAFSFQKVKARILKEENLSSRPATTTPSQNKYHLFTFWRGIAAASLLLACTGLFYLKYNHAKNNETALSFEQKTTPNRTKATIILSDGTQIILNSGSTLKYPAAFVGKTREVYLAGEAFFNVHKDHEHPFIIHTGKMNVKVLGTEFNVRSYPNEKITETSLIRGSIEVTLSDRPSDHIILKPKEKLIVQNNNLVIEKHEANNVSAIINKSPISQYTLTSVTYLNNVDTAVIETSWLKNQLVANNEEFADLAKKMDRFYGVDIQFANPEIEKLRFSATFEKETVKQALNSLKMIEQFHYKMDKSTIYIY